MRSYLSVCVAQSQSQQHIAHAAHAPASISVSPPPLGGMRDFGAHFDAAETVAALASLAHADHAQCRLQVVERGVFERWQGRVGYVSSLGA